MTAIVSRTTWMIDGAASKILWAVTTTAGRRKPASRRSGAPNSISTTSPESGIEPAICLGPDSDGYDRTKYMYAEERP
jgi:hypothetical protein